MKNINYFNNLFSRVKEHSSPTVNRRSTDGQSQRQYTFGIWKYVAMMALLLTLACGQMWGASYTWDFTGYAEKTSLTSGSTYDFTSGGKTLYYVAYSSDVIRNKDTEDYFKLGGGTYYSSSIPSGRYFYITAPSSAGKITVNYADSKAGNARILKGTNRTILLSTITGTVSSACESGNIYGLTAGTTVVTIAFEGQAYIESITWTDVDAPTYTSSYYSEAKESPTSGATYARSAGSETSGGSGIHADFAKYSSLNNNATGTFTFATPLTLNSNGSNKGCVRVYYGVKSCSLSINGGDYQALTTPVSNVVNYYEYTIPDGTSNISTLAVKNTGGANGGLFYAIEVLTYPAASDTWYIGSNFSDGDDETWDETQEITPGSYVDIDLGLESHYYKFKMIKDNGSKTYYGNDGDMERANCTSWAFSSSDDNDCYIRTDIAGTYRFAMTINGSGQPVVTVTYPTGVAVTLNMNGGGDPDTWQAYTDGVIPVPGYSPSRDGYAFDGWYADSEGTEKWVWSTTVNSATTLYAKWSHAWYYAEEDDSWANHVMTRSPGESYWYRSAAKKGATRQFKIQQNGTWYDCRQSSPGYYCTDITNMNNSSNKFSLTDNRAGVYETESNYYIIVFPPYTPANSTGSPIICASKSLPEDYYSLPSGRTIYFDNSDAKWSNLYFRKGKDKCAHNEATALSKVSGTDNLYYTTTAAVYDGYQAFQIANNCSWTGSNNSIYLVNPDGTDYDITAALEFQKYALDEDVTFTPGDEGNLTDGCQYYKAIKTSGMKTDNVAITAPTNGSISVTYTSGSGGTLTSGNADLAHTSILTISATGATGYDLDELTVNEEAHTSGENYILSEDAVVAATFTLHDYNVTYSAPSNGDYTISVAGGEATSETKTATYGQTITLAASANTGYHLGSWTVTGATSGDNITVTNNQFSMPAENVTVTATFVANTYTITLDRNGGSGDNQVITATYGLSTLSAEVTTPTRDGYEFRGWYNAAGGTGYQVINTSGTLNASVTGFTNASSEWIYTTTSSLTLVARWTQCSAYSFTYGTHGENDWTSACFTQVGETHEWNITDFTIPNKPNFYVGWKEDFVAANLGNNGSWSVERAWTDVPSQSDSKWQGQIVLLPTASSAVGQATGAVGKLVIWDNSANGNLYVGFKPNGYGLTYAAGTIAFNNWGSTFCETDVVTLTSDDASGNFQVKLATSDSYVACAHGTAENASAVNGRKITGDADIANGKKGVFQMWTDAAANNFGLRFVTVHDVSFDMQSHGDAISDYTNVRYNDKIVAPSDPSASGYTFGGWYKEPGCTNAWDFANDVVTEATTLYAKWTVNQYSVTHSLSNVTATSGATGANAATYGTNYTAVFAAAGGYTLPATITVTIGGSTKTDGTEYTWTQGTGTVEITGSYITGAIVITVTGEEEGDCTPKTLASIEVKDNDEGQNASGDSIAASGGYGVNLENSTTSHSEKTGYKIGSSKYVYLKLADNRYFRNGDTAYVFITKLSDQGDKKLHIFTGTTTAGTEVATVASPAKGWNKAVLSNVPGGKTQSLTVHRSSSTTEQNFYIFAFKVIRPCPADTYTITYNCDEADSGCPEEAESQTALPDPLPSAPTKSGYYFDGWYTTSAKTVEAMAGGTLTSDTTLYAKWLANHTVTVSYGTGGTASAASTTVAQTKTTAITATPSTGYTFSSWAVSGTGATLSSTSTNPTTLTMGTANATVTASFAAKSYTLTLDKNHSSASAAASTSSVDYDATSFTPTAPTYDGHSVDGYYTSANCTTLVATAAGALQASITVSETTWTNSSSEWKKDGAATFYAHWKCNTPSISCTDNVVTITVPTGSTVYYTTNGSTPTAGSLEYDPSNKPTISANTTITAIAIQSGCTSSDVASEDCTFTGDCSPTTLFSMVVDGSASDYELAGSSSVTNSDDVVSSRLTSISGGTLTINTLTSSKKYIFDDHCLQISSNDVRCDVELSGSKTIQAGDIITITTRTAYHPYITAASTRATNPTLATSDSKDPYTYTLTVANTSAATGKNLIGASTLYLWKNSSTVQIHSITITRPCAASTHAITYSAGEGSGTMTGHPSVSHNGSQALTSNSFTAPDNYTFAGWVADVDVTIGGSTVKAGALIANGATITNITSDIALTAKWKQTITLNANTSNHGSGNNTSAVAILNGTALNSISHTTAASGYKLAGYYTAATSGTKVLNSDGSFASTAVTDYISDSKWTRTGAAPTLYAQYEASGSIKWNLKVNSADSPIITSSKNSSYTQISTSNMTDLDSVNLSITASKKGGMTSKITAPTAFDKDKYMKVTFQVASGYQFKPSSIKVPIQPVSGDADVKLVLVDNAATPDSIGKVQASLAKGKLDTVEMTNSSVTYTGTVTLKIYCYGSSTGTYRLGTPIQIDGAVEATCTMPSYESVSYSQTEYTVGDTPSSISVEDATGDPTYQWKYNSTGDRSSGTNGVKTASMSPSTASAGTTYYWCELTNACGTVKTPAVAITVSESKSDAPSIAWTDPASTPNYGGGGYTIRATVNDDSWDGNASDLTITAPAGIRIYNTTTGTNGNSMEYIEVKFDVQTAFDRETYSSNIPFTVSADATASYNAISADHNVSYSACSGGGGSATEELMPVDDEHMDNSTWKGGWVYDGIGMMRYGHGSSDIAAGKDNANLTTLTYRMESNQIDTYYKSSANHFGFYTEKAITGIRLYVYTSNDNVTVSGVYVGNSAFGTSTPSSGAVSYEAEYNDDNDALRSGTHSGSAWVEITFDSEVAAKKYGQINLSKNVNIAGIAFISASGSGATLTTTLAWSETVDNDTHQKAVTTSDASFTITASPTSSNSNTLGAITYSSNHPEYAAVNATTGQVTPKAEGTAQITATLAASGCYESATATYTVVVSAASCTEAAGTVTAEDLGCDGMRLTVSDYEAGASSIQWYKDGVSLGESYQAATCTVTVAGTYYAVTHKTCDRTSNSIELAGKAVTASKLVDGWYVKNGRITPDIALVQTEGAESFIVKSGETTIWDEANKITTGFAGCGFTLGDDGIIYLRGAKTDGAAPSGLSAGDETLTITAKVCSKDTSVSIVMHKQIATTKPVLAFVVTGTEKGGWTAGISADQTTNVELYNEIAKNFDVLATNVYSTDDEQTLKEYYSQFDILCITDYPNTKTKGVNKKSYVDAIGALIDIRPILTMEAWVSGLTNWKSKGISGTPKSPTTRQYSMLLQCKDHEIFSGTNPTTVGSGDETMYRIDMVDKTIEEYPTLDAYTPGSKDYDAGGKPALQGFTYDASMSSLLPIGRIDDGAGNDLEVGVERQEVMEARLLVLGINGYAMERLEDDGQTIVINALKYLLKKDAEDISDCSNYFLGGAEGDETNWFNTENWSGSTLPDRTQEVRIVAPCEIGGNIARAASVKIITGGKFNHGSQTANGSLTINPTGSLIVDGKIYAATAPNYFEKRATEPEHLIVKADADHTGTLIFDNEDGDTQATIEMYSKSYWETVEGKYKKYWSYVGMPIKDVHIPDYFYGAFTYYYNETKGWERRFDNDIMQPFEGIGLSMQTGHKETFYGTMVSTENVDIKLTSTTGYGDGDNLIGNSWTAPIQIANFDASDFGDALATIYIFNTGREGKTYVDATEENDGAATAGQWLGVPISVAGLGGYSGLKVIPAMNAFLVYNDEGAGTTTTLHLDYEKLVRDGASSDTQINEPMRAPRKKKDVEGLLRIRVVGEKTNTDVWMMQDPRFSEAFDNGWEAYYTTCDDRSAQLYARSSIGRMSFLALPDLDGTVLGFAPSRDGNNYTFTFKYRGEDEYYLNDLKLQQSVLINADNTYDFIYEKGDANRFYISRTPLQAPQNPTGIDNTQGTSTQSVKAIKVIYNDKLYIIRGGRVYSADGSLVK